MNFLYYLWKEYKKNQEVEALKAKREELIGKLNKGVLTEEDRREFNRIQGRIMIMKSEN